MKNRRLGEGKEHVEQGRHIGTGLLLFAAFLSALLGLSVILFRDYTVSMDLADGSEAVEWKYNINSGSMALDIPVRNGYRFVGWTGSNGDSPQRNIVIAGGTIGNRYYTANWSDQLDVTCEDWLIDKYGNRVTNITQQVDNFLASGGSSSGYQPQERTIQRKVGDIVDPEQWGNDNSYKAYSDSYTYVGSSGKVRVENDGLIIYRYFYAVFDVDIYVNGENVLEKQNEVVSFDIYVENDKIASNVSDYCYGIPYNARYEVKNIRTKNGYRYADMEVASGTMGDSRLKVNLMFYTG